MELPILLINTWTKRGPKTDPRVSAKKHLKECRENDRGLEQKNNNN